MRSRIFLVSLALVAAGLVALRACGGGQEELIIAVPPELAGTWRTDAPGYSDRYIEIAEQEIAFGQGEEGEARYALLGVVRIPDADGRAHYSLRYRIDVNTEAEGRLEVLLGAAELRIPSQPGILWTVQR